jgi:hypothetical protein
LPRRHLLKQSLTKVSTGVTSPRPPLPFPHVPGRRRPLDAAAHRRTEAAPASDRLRTREEEEGFLPNPPTFLLFPLSPVPIPSLSFSFQIAPRLMINCRLNTVEP